MTLTHGGLFEGYGGLTMAARAVLGGELAWVSEYEPPSKATPNPKQAAARLLAHRHPNVPNLGDITAIDWPNIEPVDVLCGGFPCQDVSSAGKRVGMKPDSRSGLWEHFARAISVLRPSIVLIENVRGLLSAEAACDLEPCPWCLGDGPERPLRALGAVLGDLAGLGYDARWCGVRAAEAGAPHERFRVFILAWPAADPGGEAGQLGPGLRPAEPQRLGRGRPDHDGVADAAADPARERRGEGRAEPARVERRPDAPERGELAPADADCDGREGRPERDERPCGGQSAPLGGDAAGRVLGAPAAADAPGVRDADESLGGDEEGQPVGAVAGPGAGDRAGRAASGVHELGRAAGELAWGPYETAIRRWERLVDRPAPAPTQTGQRGGQQLSPRFVEWMMGLPEGWVTEVPGLTRNEQLKLLGNGVVPQQAEHALRLLLARATTGAVAA